MNPAWAVLTGRLSMQPVAAADLADLIRLKGDPRVFAVMLGGVRGPAQVVDELAEEVAFWGRRGVGIWSVRQRASGQFLGITGFMQRPDGLGVALRFALIPAAQGHGYASEAASAALRFAHERAGLGRVVAVAREDNFASRQVLGGIGMRLAGRFERGGVPMLIYESLRAD
jgi:RimJ/RimL family protein N-acetyltransferase